MPRCPVPPLRRRWPASAGGTCLARWVPRYRCYADEPGSDGGQDAIVDPAGQLPAIWFQQMDAPRPQRNRVHFDITVAHDEAELRVRAALDAGGRLVNDSFAPSFWVLADVEGNEACVCTWTERDERGW
jgi:glyoxalase superfamily protein